MSSSIDPDRDALVRLATADVRRGWIPIAVLGAVGASLLAALRSDTSAITIAALSLAAAAALAVRQLEAHRAATRLIRLLERPDLIVWIYRERDIIYVCSRRGERLRLAVHGAQQDLALGLLARLAPRVTQGFTIARDAAFDRDPLSVTSA